ncbi:hypothetical protein BVC93_31710 (plasmid) [Mycobacterium sp. MS1601]|uniref:hypothetical protein n=1 Tax=Mycobacterium sp. MS1601 TaxID=1936029 RepID=UPI0009792CAB|nr:hypothetical protein [Mycobacterium sp. MS1601]AQA07058.1 hypothetical protein BVC93_31710 [Mycobacterium sp. MS1601]
MSDNNDWFEGPGWQDDWEPIDPGGAAAGPGAIGPVPAQLISNTSGTGDYHWEIGDDGLTRYIQELDPIEGAGPGPSVGGGLAPVSNTTGPAGSPGGAGAPFQVNYAELEKFAKEHDLNAQEIADWASGDPDFPSATWPPTAR